MYDMQAITKLLDGFSLLDNSLFSQTHGHVVNAGQECGACCGAWAAFFLNVPKREEFIDNEDFYKVYQIAPAEDNRVSYWYYHDGANAMENLFFLSASDLEELLHNHGAALDPFSVAPWKKSHYDVLRDVVQELTGIAHEPPVHEFPEDQLKVELIEIEADAPCQLDAQPGQFILDR